MAKGDITFRVDADDADARKKLDDLNKDIEKANKEINKTQAEIDKASQAVNKAENEHNGIVDQMEAARHAAEEARAEIEALNAQKAENESVLTGRSGDVGLEEFEARKQAQAEIEYELQQQNAALAESEKTMERLAPKEETALAKVEEKTAQLEKQKELLAQQNAQYETQVNKAGELERIAAQRAAQEQRAAEVQAKRESAQAAMDNIKSSLSSGFKSILKWGFGIRSLFILFRKLKSYIISAVKSFAETDEKTKSVIDGFKSGLDRLKAAWGAAFAPIVTAVAPLVNKLISILTDAANAVSRFLAILQGKSTFTRAINNAENMAGALTATANAANDAKRQLSGLDEMNIWQSQSGGGGGGGSGTGAQYEEIGIDAGKSFLDVIAEAFGSLASWFEGKDWSEIGGKAWETLKKLFSDADSASAAVSAFFETLGAAFGAVAGTAWGFLSTAADDIYKRFKKEITDYNGDGKIDPFEFIKSAFKTWQGFNEDTGSWFVEHIIGPFLDGAMKSLSGEGLSEEALGELTSFGGTLWSFLTELLLFGPTPETSKEMAQAIAKFLEAIGLPTEEEMRGFGTKAWEWLKEGWNEVATDFDLLVIQPADEVWETIKGWGTTIWNKIKEGYDNAAESLGVVIELVKGWKDKIVDWIKSKLSSGEKNADGTVKGPDAKIGRTKGWTSTFKEWILGLVSRKSQGTVVGPDAKIGRVQGWTTTFKEWILGLANRKKSGTLVGPDAKIGRVQGWTTTFKEWILKLGNRTTQGTVLGPDAKIGRTKGWTTTFKEWLSGGDGQVTGPDAVIGRVKGWLTSFVEWLGGSDGKVDGPDAEVGLTKKDGNAKDGGWNTFSTIAGWILSVVTAGAIPVDVTLVRNGWTTIKDWVKSFFGFSSNNGIELGGGDIKAIAGSSSNAINAMPAMAGGTIVPPLIMTRFEGSYSVDDIVARLDRLLTAQERPIQINTAVEAKVNNKVLFSAVVQQGQAQKNATGKNPFNL